MQENRPFVAATTRQGRAGNQKIKLDSNRQTVYNMSCLFRCLIVFRRMEQRISEGPVAQLGAHYIRIVGVESSNLFRSTKLITGRTQDDRIYVLPTGFVLVSKIASKP